MHHPHNIGWVEEGPPRQFDTIERARFLLVGGAVPTKDTATSLQFVHTSISARTKDLNLIFCLG